MVFKMRAMYYPEASNAEKVALAIAAAQNVDRDRTDKIPPAYNVEKERLVFIGVELKGSLKPVIDFCKNLNPDRAKNVAFFAIGGSFDKMSELRQIAEQKGVNVAGSMLEIKSSGLLKKTIADEDVKKAVAWATEIVDSLRD